MTAVTENTHVATQLTFRWQAPTFQETREYWDAVLRESGFHDLEPVPGGMLSHDTARDKSAAEIAEGEAYYCMAKEYLARTRFPWRIERVIWAAHARGQTMREIVTTARAARLACVQLRHVHAVIAKHREKMLTGIMKRR